jgi:hypothetical protein
MTHDRWSHDSLGWFAVRLEEGAVTGICGPLSWHAALGYEFDPAACMFDESEWAIRQTRESPEQGSTTGPGRCWLR